MMFAPPKFWPVQTQGKESLLVNFMLSLSLLCVEALMSLKKEEYHERAGFGGEECQK